VRSVKEHGIAVISCLSVRPLRWWTVITHVGILQK